MMNSYCRRKDKCIAGMLQVITGNIGDREMLKKYQINAIVNAANPTLMGSDQGVDGSIHSAINKLLKGGKRIF